MENRRPSQGKANGFGTAPTPPWVWLLLIGVLGLIFWLFVPKNEVQVLYYPWFMEQVHSGNIKALTVQGNEMRGQLRAGQRYDDPSTRQTILVTRFITHAPSENSIQPIVQTLIQNDKKSQDGAEQAVEPTRIEVQPPNSSSGLAWIMLMLPTFVILGFIYLMMRRARVAVHGVPQGRFDGEEAKVARAEASILEAVRLCRDLALPLAQKERLERAVSELAQVLKGSPQPEV
jgi:cell division protease FtsH